MIKVKKYAWPRKEGFYSQKLVMDEGKIIDAQCDCRWGQVHKRAWKEGDTICKHLSHALLAEDLRRKNGKKD